MPIRLSSTGKHAPDEYERLYGDIDRDRENTRKKVEQDTKAAIDACDLLISCIESVRRNAYPHASELVQGVYNDIIVELLLRRDTLQQQLKG